MSCRPTGASAASAQQRDEFPPHHGNRYGNLDEGGSHVIARDQVRMEMEHHLAAPAVHVDEEPITGVGHPELSRYLPCHKPHMGKEVIAVGDVVEGRQMFPRHDEHMNGRSRSGVSKCYDRVVFIKLFRGYSTVNYLAENTVVHGYRTSCSGRAGLTLTRVGLGDHMHVKMEHDLTAAPVDIEEDSISGLSDTKLFGYLYRNPAHVGEYIVVGTDVIQRGDMLSRDDQYVKSCNGVCVPESEGPFILVDHECWNSSIYYLTKNAILDDITHLLPL